MSDDDYRPERPSDNDLRRQIYEEMDQRQQQARQQQRSGVRIAAERQPTLTMILIGINVAIFALMLFSPQAQLWLLETFWAYPPAILNDLHLHRLVTAMFLHDPDTLLHIAFNMYALYVFGRDVELLFGTRRFAIIYFLGGISGSVLSVAEEKPAEAPPGVIGVDEVGQHRRAPHGRRRVEGRQVGETRDLPSSLGHEKRVVRGLLVLVAIELVWNRPIRISNAF